MNTENKNPDNQENPLIRVQTTDWNKERLETLKKLYPDLFVNEGKVDVREIAKLMDYASVNEVERYEFRWFGKSHAKREAFTSTDATFVYDETKSVYPSKSENLIIEGENLAVLKLLSSGYREQIKCIYIDPPYNTGKDFVYSDNWKQDKKQYWEDTEMTENGYKIDSNTETDGRFHSNWLNMMYSRLLIARQLLKEDGVIFISIDDHEVHHLRKICDEVFGENNFVIDLIRKTKSTTNDAREGINIQHENCLVYAKNKENLILLGGEKDLSRYINPDNDLNGDWASDNPSAKSGNLSNYFEVKNPYTNKIDLPPQGMYWRFSQNTIQKHIDSGVICFKKKYKKGERGFIYKRYKNKLQTTQKTLDSLNFSSNKYMNQKATKELLAMELVEYFKYPKSCDYISKLVEHSTKNNDIILDFFAGSGTTGQAVTELNQEDGGNRQYILVQLPEQTAENSEAFKAGYKKISDITIERNKRVSRKNYSRKERSNSSFI